MKNTCVNIIFDLKNIDFPVKIANLNNRRRFGKTYKAEQLNKIGMLPEHLKL